MRVCILLYTAALAAQTMDESMRDIVDSGFRNQRLSATPSMPKHAPPAYRVATGTPVVPKPTVGQSRQTIGLTLWQARPAKPADGTAPRVLLQSPSSDISSPAAYVLRRVPIDEPLAIGDRVRLAIECPREGYLYVVNRERYRNGKVGEPYLLFPVRNLNQASNKVKPGQLIEIPGQGDPVSLLNVVRRGEEYIGEELLVVFSLRPLEAVGVPNPDRVFPIEIVKQWEREFRPATLRLDLNDGGALWSQAEKSAGTAERLLTQADPMPQSIFVAETLPERPFLVRVSLEVR